MDVNKFLRSSFSVLLLNDIISNDVFYDCFYKLHLKNEYEAESEIFLRNELKVAGVKDDSLFKSNVESCFENSFSDIKMKLKCGSDKFKVYFSDVLDCSSSKYETIGPAAFKRDGFVDVYGLHGLSLEFVVEDNDFRCVSIDVDWNSVDDRLIHTESMKEISRRVLQEMTENLQDKVDISDSVESDLEI